jgi:hypothetical protein
MSSTISIKTNNQRKQSRRIAKKQNTILKIGRATKRKKARNSARLNNSSVLRGLTVNTGRIGLSNGGQSNATTRRAQVIEEDEYIADVAGSVAFTVTQYSVNPGNSTTFPWASRIASLYEEYEFEMLEFYYSRLVSEFATNGQAGEVILNLDYNASDPAPTTKQQVLDSEDRVMGMPCDPLIVIKADCALMRQQPSKYVLSGTQPNNTDIKTFNCANLNVCTVANTNTSTIGELHVRYRCRLKKPVLEADAGGFSAAHIVTGAATATAASPLGLTPYTSATVQTGSTLTLINGATMTGYSGNTVGLNDSSDAVLTLPNADATWLVQFYFVGTGIAAVPTITASGGATQLSVYNAGVGLGFFTAAGGSASITQVFTTTYDATPVFGSTNILTVGGLTSYPGGTVNIYVVRLPTALVTAPNPVSSSCSFKDELAALKRDFSKELNALKYKMRVDSDFEEEEKSSSSSHINVPLTQSMLGAVADYVSKRSISNK